MKHKQPIRILQVVTLMDRAGLETMLMNYYRSIDRSKVQFDFLVHRHEKGDYDDEILQLGGKIYHFDPISPRTLLSYRKKLREFLADHSEYKIIHSHIDALSTFPLSAAKDANIPVRIAHSHNSGFSIDRKLPIRLIAKALIPRYATDLFGCSNEAAQFMFGKSAKYGVIRNAIDADKFSYNQNTRSRIRKQLGINNKFVLGHVGRFMDQKNHEFLIEILSSVKIRKKDAVLILIGVGENETSVRQKVEDLGLEDSVYFLGSRSDVADVMQAMDIFVLPSLYEGLPLVAIEAQMNGLACILCDSVSREARIHENCLFIDIKEGVEHWSDAIIQTSQGIHRESKLKDTSSEFDIKSAVKKLEEMYGNFIQR